MIAPVIGTIPFGLIVGVISVDIGMSMFEAGGASTVIYAGSAQLASYELIGRGAPFLVVLTTALVINLRFAIYSAAIATEFRGERTAVRWLCAYLLTDHTFALTAARRAKEPEATNQVAYYLGCTALGWVMWIATTIVGAAVGAAIPASWSLDFTIPLCFVALLAPLIKDRAQLVCALLTGAASLVLLHAPHNSVVILSVIIGIGGASLFDSLSARRRKA